MNKTKAGCQTIGCKVNSCTYNDEGSHCRLDSIMVQPGSGCHTGNPADESLCGSYKSRA